jgi:hypothetical protein
MLADRGILLVAWTGRRGAEWPAGKVDGRARRATMNFYYLMLVNSADALSVRVWIFLARIERNSDKRR